ncbi:protein of unknown function [Azospirillum lipoferum 4B]|uniref:Uncharacterized protein n=1 Tax=Azospirillum lipoferum (strain 4B) TaxID=862719 RepID=G7Z598_AZOL4|nr:protein of unknown function [Azospirillum lipoferum 4B]
MRNMPFGPTNGVLLQAEACPYGGENPLSVSTATHSKSQMHQNKKHNGQVL